MSKASLIVGNSNWAIKDSSLLGYNINDSNIYSPFPFDVTRATPATIVNKAGLIVTDTEIVSGELITNGDFATDSNWNKLNSTISGGKGNLIGDGVTSLLSQNILTNTKKYTATFTISNYNSIGESNVINDNGDVLFPITSNGTFTFTFTQSVVSPSFLFKARLGSIYSIDNVSVVEVNQNNLARIDYLDSTKGVLLTEPQSTNQLNGSNSFTFTYGSQTTISDNAGTSPDGTVNARKIIPTTVNTPQHRNGGTFLIGFVENDVVSASAFFKADGYDFVRYGGFFGNESAAFDLLNGTVLSEEANVISSKIISLTNGWYRLEVNYTFQNTIGNNGLYLGAKIGSESSFSSFAGDGVKGVLTYGWQFEKNMGYCTSYIPTVNSTVTRNQDLVTNGGEVSTFNSKEGVLYAEIAALSDDLSIRYISLSDGSIANEIYLRYDNVSNRIVTTLTVGGAPSASFISTAYDITNLNKIAFKYKENDFSLWINGVKIAEDTSGSTFPINTLNSLSFYRSNATGPFFGKTSQVQVFKKALTDAELIKLTTI